MARTGNGANGSSTAGDGTKSTGKGGLIAVRPILVGTEPLLMQAMSSEKIVDIVRKFDGEKVKKGMSRDEARAWMLEHMVRPNLSEQDGVFGIFGKALRAALIEGGSYVTLTGRTKFTSGKKSLVSVFLRIVEDFLPFPAQGQEWSTDLDHGWGQTGTFVAIARPRFDAWAIRPTLVIDANEYPESKFRELVEVTGQKVGIGGHRPGRKGSYGTFGIGAWEVLDAVPASAQRVDVVARAAEFTWAAQS